MAINALFGNLGKRRIRSMAINALSADLGKREDL